MGKMRKIIIIKIGGSVLFTDRNKLDEFRVAHIVDQLLSLRKRDIYSVLVVSGAVASGSSFVNRQLAAGVGQIRLMSSLQSLFQKKRLDIAQILLTREQLYLSTMSLRLNGLLTACIDSNVVPIFNENDVVELNSFGGNDLLAAELSIALKVNQLIILSTMAGSKFGVGGGETKKQATELLRNKKIVSTIVNGKLKNVILDHVI